MDARCKALLDYKCNREKLEEINRDYLDELDAENDSDWHVWETGLF